MVIEIIKYTSIPIIYEPIINLNQTFIFVGNGIVLDSNYSIWTILLLNELKRYLQYNLLNYIRLDSSRPSPNSNAYNLYFNRFVLNGSEKITCLQTGEWSESAPTCENKLTKGKE